MFQSAQVISRPLTNDFFKVWASRYTPDTVKLSQNFTRSDLISAVSPEGRLKTAINVKKRLKTGSELAEIKTHKLFSQHSNLVEFVEIKTFAAQIEKIYIKLLDIYQNQSSGLTGPLLDDLVSNSTNLRHSQEWLTESDLLDFEKNAIEIESFLLTFKQQHFACRDSRITGFMSTHFHYLTGFLIDQLCPVERALVEPYMRFLEEQVCIPWRRVCKAANRHDANDPVLDLAKTMLGRSQETSRQIYHYALTRFPTHRSRSGSLRSPRVAASSIRDLTMFQTYIWLCILEESCASIEHELIPLCLMVYPMVSVDWELVELGIGGVISHIAASIAQSLDDNSAQKVKPYLEQIISLFSETRRRNFL